MTVVIVRVISGKRSCRIVTSRGQEKAMTKGDQSISTVGQVQYKSAKIPDSDLLWLMQYAFSSCYGYQQGGYDQNPAYLH